MRRAGIETPGTPNAIDADVESGCVSSVDVGAADPARLAPHGYRPRVPEHGALHRLVHEHLETFLAEARDRSDGDGLPRFVEHDCGSS